jgi:hypothetical protein
MEMLPFLFSHTFSFNTIVETTSNGDKQKTFCLMIQLRMETYLNTKMPETITKCYDTNFILIILNLVHQQTKMNACF